VVKNGSKARASGAGAALARSGDFEAGAVAGRRIEGMEHCARGPRRTARAGGQAYFSGGVAEGLGGVVDEVEHELAPLRGFGFNGREVRRQGYDEPGLFADRDVQEAGGVLHKLVASTFSMTKLLWPA
jgi:hypothetical protein